MPARVGETLLHGDSGHLGTARTRARAPRPSELPVILARANGISIADLTDNNVEILRSMIRVKRELNRKLYSDVETRNILGDARALLRLENYTS